MVLAVQAEELFFAPTASISERARAGLRASCRMPHAVRSKMGRGEAQG